MKTLKKLFYISIYSASLLTSFSAYALEKFEPADGKKLLFIGQDLEAVGGVDEQLFNVPVSPNTPMLNPNEFVLDASDPSVGVLFPMQDGYLDHFPTPAGFTSYTALPLVWGLDQYVDYGSGPQYADYYSQDKFEGAALALGVFFSGSQNQIAEGVHDAAIFRLAAWLKSFNRPVFLRIGYEFNLPDSYGDGPEYIQAWRRIVTILRDQDVTNTAFVWQSWGSEGGEHGDRARARDYWPGSEYVDWVGLSVFGGNSKMPIQDKMIYQIAVEHDKPIFVAEASNVGTDLSITEADFIWDDYYQPLFYDNIYNENRVKALAYINQDWTKHSIWSDAGWPNANSRLQDNQELADKWLTEISKSEWINAGEALYDAIGYTESEVPPTPEVPVIDLSGRPNPTTENCIEGSIDFNAAVLGPFANEDIIGNQLITDDGCTLILSGNNWKLANKITHKMTKDTVLIFEYYSEQQGEVQGVFFDIENPETSKSHWTFNLSGHQDWGIKDYTYYEPGTYQTIEIPVGLYFAGYTMYLGFVNDDDTASQAITHFRNVRFMDR